MADGTRSEPGAAPVDVAEAKRELRRSMRAARRALPDRARRSALVVERLLALPEVAGAGRVLAYASVPGEVETDVLVATCRARGAEVAVPEDDVAPTWPDVVIVPGTAFTPDGRRLGQGGGWYDRFLPRRRPSVPAIGVGFDLQLVDDLATEDHDVRLDAVVVESGVHRAGPSRPGRTRSGRI